MGLYKALSQFSMIAAICLLHYPLPVVAKLSKAPQMKQVDLSEVSFLVDAVLQSLDDAIYPAANLVLEVLDSKNSLCASNR